MPQRVQRLSITWCFRPPLDGGDRHACAHSVQPVQRRTR
jgi:hypothetical protein